MARHKSRQRGTILVDHGSKREASNQMLLEVVRHYEMEFEEAIVEPAHMELAVPDIATAYRRCVERGSDEIVVQPFILFPGRHWYQDIPALVREAAEPFPNIPFVVTGPLGSHAGFSRIIHERIATCLERCQPLDDQEMSNHRSACSFCHDELRCQWTWPARTESSPVRKEAT